MNRKTVIIMAVIVAIETAVLVALVFSINPSDTSPAITNPDKIEGRKPLSWDAQENRDWLYAMPYKADMRHMWIGCNRMVSAGRGDANPNIAEIHTSAKDVSQRAGKYAEMWGETAEYHIELVDSVEEDRKVNWILFNAAMNDAWNSCNNCHMAAWSPAYKHVTEGVIQAWNHNRLTPHEKNTKAKEPPPEIPNRKTMQTLQAAFDHIDKCFAQKDTNSPEAVDKMVEGAQIVIRIAEERAAFWTTIKEQADLILGTKDTDEIREAYNVMTAQCIACHATQAGEMREIMTPLSWHK